MCGGCAARRGGGAGGPRWPRSGGASAGLPPRARRRHAPSVPRVPGCQQRWNMQRGRASGTVNAQRLRKWMISATSACRAYLSPTATREQLRLAAHISRGPMVTHLLRRLVVFSHGCVLTAVFDAVWRAIAVFLPIQYLSFRVSSVVWSLPSACWSEIPGNLSRMDLR